MIACVLIPGFELRAALRSRPGLELEPAALVPEPGTEALLGPVTVAAEAAVEREWEGVLRRLEDAGIAVEPVEPGVVVFETRGVERLYGGVAAALRRALAAVGTAWDPRAGAAGRRFAALAAASVA